VRRQICGHDWPSARKVVEHLEGKVVAVAPRRDEHVGHSQIGRHLAPSLTPQEAHRPCNPPRRHLAPNLLRRFAVPSNQHEDSPGNVLHHPPRGGHQRRESLVGLEGPGVNHDRHIGPDLEFRAKRCAGVSPAAASIGKRHSEPLSRRRAHSPFAGAPRCSPPPQRGGVAKPRRRAATIELRSHRKTRYLTICSGKLDCMS
jgi:hypothetical protein